MFQVLGGKDYTDVFKGSATRSHEPWVANLSVSEVKYRRAIHNKRKISSGMRRALDEKISAISNEMRRHAAQSLGSGYP